MRVFIGKEERKSNNPVNAGDRSDILDTAASFSGKTKFAFLHNVLVKEKLTGLYYFQYCLNNPTSNICQCFTIFKSTGYEYSDNQKNASFVFIYGINIKQ